MRSVLSLRGWVKIARRIVLIDISWLRLYDGLILANLVHVYLRRSKIVWWLIQRLRKIWLLVTWRVDELLRVWVDHVVGGRLDVVASVRELWKMQRRRVSGLFWQLNFLNRCLRCLVIKIPQMSWLIEITRYKLTRLIFRDFLCWNDKKLLLKWRA